MSLEMAPGVEESDVLGLTEANSAFDQPWMPA